MIGGDDICESLDSSQYAESGYGSEESCYDSNAYSYLMSSEAKKNLMEQSSLAESHLIPSHVNEDSDSNASSE